MIRNVRLTDSVALTELYNYYIRTSGATFEEVEITEDEIGPINIGRNITEYSWNGTDEFGDPLANGVYLYRVKAMLNGEKVKDRPDLVIENIDHLPTEEEKKQ